MVVEKSKNQAISEVMLKDKGIKYGSLREKTKVLYDFWVRHSICGK
jgi:hypothetical protein